MPSAEYIRARMFSCDLIGQLDHPGAPEPPLQVSHLLIADLRMRRGHVAVMASA
jgi:hypothetical protein